MAKLQKRKQGTEIQIEDSHSRSSSSKSLSLSTHPQKNSSSSHLPSSFTVCRMTEVKIAHLRPSETSAAADGGEPSARTKLFMSYYDPTQLKPAWYLKSLGALKTLHHAEKNLVSELTNT